LGGNESESGLLQFLVSSEGLQVCESTDSNCIVNLLRAHLGNPRVLNCLLS